MRVNTNIMVTTVVTITDRLNVTFTKVLRNALHRHHRVTKAATSMPYQGLAGDVIGSVLGNKLGAQVIHLLQVLVPLPVHSWVRGMSR